MIETTWLSNYGKVCAGMDWELFPTVDDAKVPDGNLVLYISSFPSNSRILSRSSTAVK